jgi:signal transduction histidine kinase
MVAHIRKSTPRARCGAACIALFLTDFSAAPRDWVVNRVDDPAAALYPKLLWSTPMSPLYVHIALTLAFVESIGLALLLLRARGVPGLRLLVAFLCGVGAWVLSCELTTWLGDDVAPVSYVLIALSPLTSAVFLHFVLVLCGAPRRRATGIAYAIAAATTLLCLARDPGVFAPWRGFASVFHPNAIGWTVGIVWSLLAIAGHLVLLWHWWQRRGPPRGQLVAMCMASGWGALCMTGYAFSAVGIDAYPFPLLALPLYPLILVYGILRYRLMIVNAWARRGLAWALLVGIGSATVIALAALPLPFSEPVAGWKLWLVAVTTLLAAGLLLDPFRRLATRFVYPGSQLADAEVERWRGELSGADSFAALGACAADAISAQLRLRIEAVVDAPVRDASAPTLVCRRAGAHWRTELTGWDAAPPGPRYVAQLFGTLLADAAARLEQAMALAQRERQRQQQERLAELGALAATVAHDIRNPLNIIAMAAAAAPPDVRQEIGVQATRIAQLATDLLDYAKSWQAEKQCVNLADHLATTLSRYTDVDLGTGIAPGTCVDADPRRLSQAVLNLVENARAALGGKGRVQLDARRRDDALEILVCDNGAGVPAEIRDQLFQPFVSRRPDGTGLGLAIVAKIMQAHGGSARLEAGAGWRTCFVLSFPMERA